MDFEQVKTEVENILNNSLPSKVFKYVGIKKNFYGGYYLRIGIAASEHNINGVSGQKPQIVSLCLDFDEMELKPQIFGGNGGQCLYRKPDPNNPKEKYLAMCRVKLPFRKPKPELKFIYKAIEGFCDKWVKAINDNIDVLMYKDIIDYREVLDS